jgi:uncharacterized protein (DUF488 family)
VGGLIAPSRPTLFTIGHGDRSLDEFVALLRDAGIGVLVDVRRYPGSRRHPHFGRDALASALAESGIDYVWEGAALGGMRRRARASRHGALADESFRAFADHMDTPAFASALARVLDDAARRPAALMCAEKIPAHCHRSLIADAALTRGASVVHLIEPGRREDARLHPAARICGDAVVYDAGVQTPFDF